MYMDVTEEVPSPPSPNQVTASNQRFLVTMEMTAILCPLPDRNL